MRYKWTNNQICLFRFRRCCCCFFSMDPWSPTNRFEFIFHRLNDWMCVCIFFLSAFAVATSFVCVRGNWTGFVITINSTDIISHVTGMKMKPISWLNPLDVVQSHNYSRWAFARSVNQAHCIHLCVLSQLTSVTRQSESIILTIKCTNLVYELSEFIARICFGRE